jgi:UDP-N-acetylmuramate--alanine ligase
MVIILGIGGSGMSSLAHILADTGIEILGYDKQSNSQVQFLRERGVLVFQNWEEIQNVNLSKISSIIVSSAIKSHPVLDWANSYKIPVYHRSAALHEIVKKKYSISVAGSHGKTTTTAMVAHILRDLETHPSYMIGAELPHLGVSGGKWDPQGEWFVYESDESDGTFLNHKADIRVITNIDRDHLDHFGTMEKLFEAFRSYLDNSVSRYGSLLPPKAFLYIGDPGVREMLSGIREFSDYIDLVLLGNQEDLRLLPKRFLSKEFIEIKSNQGTSITNTWKLMDSQREKNSDLNWEVPFFGEHYRTNASLAISVVLSMGMDPNLIRESIKRYPGVKRRMEFLGESQGVRVFDDYGHHPTEVTAVLKALSEGSQNSESKQTYVIFQPHRYSRTADLYKEFAVALEKADNLFLLPIYSAGETPIPGVDVNLIGGILESKGKSPHYLTGRVSEDIDILKSKIQGKSTLLCLGAGSVRSWGEEFLKS